MPYKALYGLAFLPFLPLLALHFPLAFFLSHTLTELPAFPGRMLFSTLITMWTIHTSGIISRLPPQGSLPWLDWSPLCFIFPLSVHPPWSFGIFLTVFKKPFLKFFLHLFCDLHFQFNSISTNIYWSPVMYQTLDYHHSFMNSFINIHWVPTGYQALCQWLRYKDEQDIILDLRSFTA